MKCLFIGNQFEALNIFSFILSPEHSYQTYHAMTVENAIDQFGMENFDLVIYLLSEDSPVPLFDFFQTKGIKIPFVFTGSLQTLSDSHKFIDHHPLVGKVSYEADERIISSALKRFFGAGKRAKDQKTGYCPIVLPFF